MRGVTALDENARERTMDERERPPIRAVTFFDACYQTTYDLTGDEEEAKGECEVQFKTLGTVRTTGRLGTLRLVWRTAVRLVLATLDPRFNYSRCQRSQHVLRFIDDHSPLADSL